MNTLFVYRNSFRVINIINQNIKFDRAVNLIGINYHFTNGPDSGLESIRLHMILQKSKIDFGTRSYVIVAKLIGTLLLLC